MTPREKKPEIVYRIIERETGNAVGSYSRAYCDEYDFATAEEIAEAKARLRAEKLADLAREIEAKRKQIEEECK